MDTDYITISDDESDVSFIEHVVNLVPIVIDLTEPEPPRENSQKKPTSNSCNEPTLNPQQESTSSSRNGPTSNSCNEPAPNWQKESTSNTSHGPTLNSSNEPTSNSRNGPTLNSRVEPTTNSREQPTLNPHKQPTSYPHKQPTSHPEKQPTSHPQKQPTLDPHKQPTLDPHKQPTLDPHKQPTLDPQKQPTLDPQKQPTLSPQKQPNLNSRDEPTSNLREFPNLISQKEPTSNLQPPDPRARSQLTEPQPKKRPLSDEELLIAQKELGNQKYHHNLFDDAIRVYKRAIPLAKQLENKEMSAILHFNLAMTYDRLHYYQQAVDECINAIKINPDYLKAHLKRAELYMKQGQYEEAVICYEHLCELDSKSQQYVQLLNASKEKIKHVKKKDYPQILGLNIHFTPEDLKKAYRQQALTHHPDRHSGADVITRRIEEKRFKDVSEAYTFLTTRHSFIR